MKKGSHSKKGSKRLAKGLIPLGLQNVNIRAQATIIQVLKGANIFGALLLTFLLDKHSVHIKISLPYILYYILYVYIADKSIN